MFVSHFTKTNSTIKYVYLFIYNKKVFFQHETFPSKEVKTREKTVINIEAMQILKCKTVNTSQKNIS